MASVSRYHHLDNLRWIAMLWGMFVHSATVGDFGAIALVQESSNLFRMALFFMISGFLGSLLLERQTWTGFWIGRLRNLLIPMLFGLFVLNPPTLWLIYSHFNEDPIYWAHIWNEIGDQTVGETTGLIWHLHLWFLISLIFYVLLAPFAVGVIHPLSFILDDKFFKRRFHRLAAPWISIALIALGTVLLRITVEGAEVVFGQMPWLVRATAIYLPFYLFGILLHVAPSFKSAVLVPSLSLGSIVIILFIASRYIWFDNFLAPAISAIALGAMRAWLSITLIFWESGGFLGAIG